MSIQMRQSIRNLLTVLFVFCGVALSTLPALAQGEGAQASSSAQQGPAGIGVLIFIMGLGAILVVGVIYYSQLRAQTHPQVAEKDEE